MGSAADRAAIGLHGDRRPGGDVDLTFGRLGNRYSGFLHIGGRRGNLHLSGAVYRHPRRDRYRYWEDYHRHYGASHYYHDYPIVSFHNHCYRAVPYYGYSYDCVYYPEPVFYHLYRPAVIYVERETRYVTVDDDPDVVVVYGDNEVGPPAQSDMEPSPNVAYGTVVAPEDTDETSYEVIDDTMRSVIHEGTAAFGAGDYARAQRLFLEAVMADERDGYAKMLHAFASFALGDYELAGLTARRALYTSEVLVDQPPDLRSLYNDIDTFTAQRDALAAYVQRHGAVGNAKFLLGYVYYSTARPEEAAAMFSELVGKDAEDTLAKRMYDTAIAVERIQPE